MLSNSWTAHYASRHLTQKGAEMTRRLRSFVLPLSLSAASLAPMACGSNSSSPPAVCGDLKMYTATSTTQVSFATEIYPLLISTSASESGGCSQQGACHGITSAPLNALG